MNISLNKMIQHYRAKQSVPVPHSVWTNPIHFITCGFGVGLIPFMPGTWATLAAIPFYFVLYSLGFWPYVIISVSLVLAGIYLCDVTNKAFGTEDHPATVWDEFATFPLVMIAVPNTWYYIALAVVLFRIFDIVKPWPISWVDQNVHGGFGVMLDDVMAALASWVVLQIIVLFF